MKKLLLSFIVFVIACFSLSCEATESPVRGAGALVGEGGGGQGGSSSSAPVVAADAGCPPSGANTCLDGGCTIPGLDWPCDWTGQCGPSMVCDYGAVSPWLPKGTSACGTCRSSGVCPPSSPFWGGCNGGACPPSISSHVASEGCIWDDDCVSHHCNLGKPKVGYCGTCT